MEKKLFLNRVWEFYIPLSKVLLMMRLTSLLILLSVLQIFAGNTYSQNTRLSISLNDVKVKDVLNEIESNSEFYFLYNNKLIDVDRKVSINVKDQPVEQVLDLLFKEENVGYTVVHRQIIIQPKNTGVAPLGFQQSRAIRGKVTGDDGEPVPGATVVIKGTGQGIITDQEGNYSLANVAADAVLVFSFVGMKTREVPVAGQTTVNVVMQSEMIGLEEVVAIGYGVQKKETVTGSVATVKGDELIKSPAMNLSNAIAGRMSGVVTMQTSGEPGYDGSTIRIRGSNTLGNNDPLVVIDGVAARTGGLERLDPADIESMSILKDASAAIYGARAANGVILITTKRGKLGKPTISYSFNKGWAQPTIYPKMANAVQFATMINELEYNAVMKNPATNPDYNIDEHYTPRYSEEDIQKFGDGSDPWGHPNTDWYDAVFKDWSPQSHHSLQLQGGADNMRYFTTFGYKDEDAYYKNSATGYKQYNLRVNLDATINKYVSTKIDIAGRQENRNFPMRGAGDIFRFVARGRPTDPAYWPNGLPGPDQEYGDNPVVTTTDATGYNRDRRYYFQTNAKVEITQPWIKGLKFSGSVAWDKYIKHTKAFIKPWFLYTWDGKTYEDDGTTPKLEKGLRGPNIDQPQLTMGSEDQSNLLWSGVLSYETKIGKHNLNILAGSERETSENEFFDAMRKYYLSDLIQTLSAGGDKEKTNSGTAWERARLNYFGRVSYNYEETYLAEFVWRYDGSYMFPKNKRFGFFPGVLLGYRVSNEDFWKENIRFMDYLKIRGSWGQLGNDQIWFEDELQEYQFLSTYYYEWGYVVDNEDVKGLRIGRFPNPNITWEVANNYNVGLEGRLFNKLSFELEGFSNKRSNILWRRNASVPQTTGLTLPAENIGKVNNKGFDFKLDWTDNIGDDLMYHISVNGGYSKNKIVFWDEAPGAPDWQRSTGHPMETGLYYIYDGVFKDWAEINDPDRPVYDITNDDGLKPGDMKFKDLDGDEHITADDQKRFDKNRQPTFNGGVNLFVQYKDFDLTILFQGATGSWGRLFTESGTIGNYLENFAENHWTADNPSSEHPRAFDRGGDYWGGGNAGNNTYWMQKTDYIRLKNFELGYTLSKELLGKTGISNLRVYANGLNLFTITPAENVDPESTSDSGQYYPQPRVINLGFTLTF